MKLIEDALLERFEKLVASHIGLCIRNADSESFRKTLIVRMKILNFAGPEEYLHFLESDTGGSNKEWKALILMNTTGESYFFRDKGHFSLLQNIILPELIKKAEIQRSLRIWSAGCSTGEEPYSIAILLDMLLPDQIGWDIVIHGTDINEEFLKKAERGIYSEWSFRVVDKNIRRTYFKRHPGGWEITERIKKMVRFTYGNLMETDLFSRNSELCNMDIIICRNVFIYFKKEAVSSAFSNLIEILNIGGYLITGHGELYGHDLINLRQIIYPEAVIYKKVLASAEQTAEITRIPERIKEHSAFKIKANHVSQMVLPAPQTKIKPHELKAEMEELISKGKYAEAIDKAKGHFNADKENEGILTLMALAYANSGDYEKAESCCRKALNCNADAADPYFLLAQIAEAKGNDEEAKDLFRKALYLNPAFIAAYCELGGLYEKQNDLPRAKKVRNTAIELLSSLPSRSIVKPYNMTAGELLVFIKGHNTV